MATLVVLSMAVVVAVFSIGSNAGGTSVAAFQTLDELLAVHRRAGWQVVQAPSGQRRYRICSAMLNDLPHPDQEWIEGALHTSDGRTRKCRVEWPDGYGVAIEGLAPADGGDLQYAVLTRRHTGDAGVAPGR